MVERLRVKLGKRCYDIVVGSGLLASTGEHIAPHVKTGGVIVVSDEMVARFYLHRLTGALEAAGIRYGTVVINPGESAKSLPAFGALVETLLETGPGRDVTLIALGGGVVGDVTGFAASVLLRGVDFIQIPTTLLAQVDSSVGGKTGINSKHGKNLIGSFHQPKLVLADVATLSTLPKRQLLAGYAETLKYALIGDRKFFGWLEKNATQMLSGNVDLLTYAIVTGCKAKAAIVSADEKEAGRRALLNFGHTFAHALEAETGYCDKLLHGEAVAIGMSLALKCSVAAGLCESSDLDRVLRHYQVVGLPDSPRAVRQNWDVDRLIEHFFHDKKVKGGQPTFILSRGIGKAFINEAFELSTVRAVLAEACGDM